MNLRTLPADRTRSASITGAHILSAGRVRVALAYGLLPLLGLALLLISGYAALTEQTYDNSNGYVGELLRGWSAGQSFLARYEGLSGISLNVGTYGPQARARLVLHLKQEPGGPDIAVAKAAAADIKGENPWQQFTFPAVAGSENNRFYFEVNSPDGAAGKAVTLFWWENPAGSTADVYPQGVAYIDGRERKADLSFKLHYAPSPARLAGGVLASIGEGARLPAVLLAIVALVGLLAGLAGRLRRTDRGGAVVLPLLLAVALSNGLIYALLVPPWQGPDEAEHFANAALMVRHGLNGNAVQNLDWQGKDRDRPLEEAIGRAMSAHGFSRFVAGSNQPGASVDPGLAIYTELRQPTAYYWLGAAAIKLAGVDPYTQTDTALRIVRIISVLLSMAIVALAWVAGRLLAGSSTGRRAWLPVLLPLTVCLLPMHAFVDSMANNDVLAEFAVAALCVAALALLRSPHGLRGLGMAIVVVGLAVLSASTKSSALAAAVPLAGLTIVACVCMLAGGLLKKSRTEVTHRRPQRRVAALTGVLALSAIAYLVAAPHLFRPLGTAAGWKLMNQPIGKAPVIVTGSARDGKRVLRMGNGLSTSQEVSLGTHGDTEVTLTGYARLAPDTPNSKTVRAVARLETAGVPSARGEVQLGTGSGWVPVRATLKVPAGAASLTVRLFAREGTVDFDDLSLQGPSTGARLTNASYEQEEVGLAGPLAHLPQEARWMAEVAANPQAFDRIQLFAGYAVGQFRSFWGNFGWVAAPLPGVLFVGLLLISALALLGVAWRLLSVVEPWGWREWSLLVSLLSLVAAVVFGFARQAMLLSVYRVEAYPQGRYLFVLSIPVAWLLVAGTGAWADRAAKWAGSKASKLQIAIGHVEPRWAAWAWANTLVWFAAFTLWSVIIPYYYGS